MCSHLATERAGMGTLHLTVGASEFYPNLTGNGELTDRPGLRHSGAGATPYLGGPRGETPRGYSTLRFWIPEIGEPSEGNGSQQLRPDPRVSRHSMISLTIRHPRRFASKSTCRSSPSGHRCMPIELYEFR